MALISILLHHIARSGHSNHVGSGGTNRSSADIGSNRSGSSSGSGGGGSHASDAGSLLDALGGESLTEKERILNEKIAELQKIREQMIAQRSGSSSSDYTDKVSHHHIQIYYFRFKDL
jgi:hypothetical protein